MVRKVLVNTACPLLLIGLIAACWAAPAYGQNTASAQDTESRSRLPEPAWQVQAEAKPPIIRELRAAHEAGDLRWIRDVEQRLPKPENPDDIEGRIVVRDSGVFSGKGDPTLDQGMVKGEPGGGMQLAKFGSDVKVRPGNLTSKEWNHSMASGVNGNVYVAWQDDYFSLDYIQIYYSSDYGETWTPFGYLQSTWADLKEPCLAVGEGPYANDLLVAYIVDDGQNTAFPEVAVSSLSSPSFSPRHVPHNSMVDGYAKPVIWTNSHQFATWYAFVTCEAIVSAATQNINICAWQSKDWGISWSTPITVFGAFDSHAWRDPDGTWNASAFENFIVCYNDTDNTLYKAISIDTGATYTKKGTILSLSSDPFNPVDPEVEAAIDYNHLMICCTKHVAGQDSIGQAYSKDGGVTWTPLYTMEGANIMLTEFAPALTANEGGKSWHLVFTDVYYHVLYTRRPQDLSDYWQSNPDWVDDMQHASTVHSKKGIASHWTLDYPTITWADFRDGSPDYDTYADFFYNIGLKTNDRWISEATGGTVSFILQGGFDHANRSYFLLGSVTGVHPGFPLPGGLDLPLNWDPFTSIVYKLANTPALSKFHGSLNAIGFAYPKLDTLGPLPPGCAGITMYFAYLLYNPYDFVSNPVKIEIVP